MQLLFQRFKLNFLYIAIGLTVAFKGLSFIVARQFFTWPPRYRWLLNDERIDIFAIIIGILLVIYAFSNCYSRKVQGILLGGCTTFIGFITILEICHVIFVDQSKLLTTVVGNVFLIAVILYVARTQHKR